MRAGSCTMADWASRTARSVSPLVRASLAWVSRESTVTGGSTTTGLAATFAAVWAAVLAGAGLVDADFAGAASAMEAERNRASRAGIARGIMAGPYDI